MSVRLSAFTLLELLISDGLLAGLSVLLVFSLSGMINSYSQNNAASKSNIQGKLALQQIEDAVRKSVALQVLRNNDSPDSQLFIKTQHRDSQGAAIQDQFDLQLYCVPQGTGRLLLFRQDAVNLRDVLTPALLTYGDCTDTSLMMFTAIPTGIIRTNLTDIDLKVIAFDVRQVGTAKYTSTTPKETIPAALGSAFPALRVVLATRYDASAKGTERAGRLLTDLPPQLLNETVMIGNKAASAVPNNVEYGS